MTQQLQSVISLLEEATEGSAELDLEVTRATLPGCEILYDGEGRFRMRNHDSTITNPIRIQPLTTSLDAALSLVPEEWWAEVHARPDWPTCALHEFPLPCRRVEHQHGATKEISVCLAALKARMEVSGG